MKELHLKLKGIKKINPVVEVNGQNVKLKKDKFGNYENEILVNTNDVDIKVYRYLELNSKLWWLLSIFYFVISIFGIFDTLKEKNCIVIDFHLKINMSEIDNANIELCAKTFQTQGKAFEIVSNCNYEEISNTYFLDARAKKRKRLLAFVKVIIFIGAIVLLALLIKKVLVF